MVSNECAPFPASEGEIETSLSLSMRWAGAPKTFLPRRVQAPARIVQGGVYPLLRNAPNELLAIGFDGYAIGRVAVAKASGCSIVLNSTVPIFCGPSALSDGRRQPDDIVGPSAGIDMFDCVLPTRLGERPGLHLGRGVIWRATARLPMTRGPADRAVPARRAISTRGGPTFIMWWANEIIAGCG